MKLYFAAAESALNDLSAIKCSTILITMANGLKKIFLVPEKYAGQPYDLLVDSGAFTYQRKGGIELQKWIGQVQDFKTAGVKFDLIALDVIYDPVVSYSNYLEIIKTHPEAIPTLHFGEDISWLKKYLEHTDRICIGGMVPYKSQPEIFARILKSIFKMFNNKNLPRFHALGCFSQDILELFPFYSCDASTWQNHSRFGEFHRFNKMTYERIKSAKVEIPYIKGMHFNDLYMFSNPNEPHIKLQAIAEATRKLEQYLTELWEMKDVRWN